MIEERAEHRSGTADDGALQGKHRAISHPLAKPDARTAPVTVACQAQPRTVQNEAAASSTSGG
jgi:hypothetical protein